MPGMAIPVFGYRNHYRHRSGYGFIHWMASATTFDFLSFTHVWGRSMQGKDVVRQITAKGRSGTASSVNPRALLARQLWPRDP